MLFKNNKGKKYIVDLNILNTHNEKGCEACHQKFNLGDTVVMACGDWQDGCSRMIHENEAVYDPRTQVYYERNYYQAVNE